MPTTTTHAPGTFSWPELATTDQAAAKKFYGSLFGWQMNDTPMGPDEAYTMIALGDRSVGALYKMRKEESSMGVPPHWNSYVTVESADQSAARAKELGGKVVMEPFDVMEHGRMAVIQDPTGAAFCIWQAKANSGAGVLDETGALCWTELLTGDTAKAGTFYSGLFGWKQDPQNMGNMTYTVFKRGETPAGGMMAIQPQMGPMPPNWTPYFADDDDDKTVAKATSLGGKAMVPAQDIPGVGRFAVIQDPPGAVFAILKGIPQK